MSMPLPLSSSVRSPLPALLRALGLAAFAAVAMKLASLAAVAMATAWAGVVFPVPTVGQTVLGPAIGALTTAGCLLLANALALRLGLFDDIRRTPLALGIVGRDLPFLFAGIVFVTLYASLADGLIRAAGLPVPRVASDPLTLLAVALLVPIAEEMLLRGALMPTLERLTGTAAAIVLSALPALAALPPAPEHLMLALVPHLFVGWMAWSCRSLGAGVVLHVAYVGIRLHLAG
jgi:membrane protease YdiL (CAAX protease family)